MTNVLSMLGEPVTAASIRDTQMRALRTPCRIQTEFGVYDGHIRGRYFKDEPFYMVLTPKGMFHDVPERKFRD